MSLIARQSIKYSILSYIGVFIGTLSSIFLYPYDFSYMGEIRFLMSAATAIFPFIIMGTSASMVKFYPRFSDTTSQLNLLYVAIFTLLVNTVLLLTFYFIWNAFLPIPYWIDAIWRHFPWIVILSLFLGLIQVGCKYVSNFGRITIPVIFESIMPKLALVLSFIVFVFLHFDRQISLYIFLGIIFLSVLGLAFYIGQFQRFRIQNPFHIFKKRKFTQEFYAFSGYSLLGGIGSIVATQIDLVMIGEMLSNFSTGIYATMLSIIGLIFIPSYAINSISGPIVSNYIYEKKWKELQHLYRRVSENLYFIGSALLCVILAGAPSLFLVMKNGDELAQIFPVLYFLGGSAIFDLGTGFNSQIIAYSKYYKFTLLVTVILAFLTVILNFIFIKYLHLEVVGVAIATCISLVIFNIAKLLFIGLKFKIWPISKTLISISVLLLLGLLIAFVIPSFANPWVTLFLKPTLVLLLFYIGNYFLHILPIHQFFSKDWKKSLMG